MTLPLALLSVFQLLPAVSSQAASLESTPIAELTEEFLQAPPVAAPHLEMYGRLSPADQREFAKASALGVLGQPDGPPYVFLYKRDGKFFLEACALVPGRWEEALPAARDMRGYGRWVFENINRRRSGSGKYFVDLDSLDYAEKVRALYVRATLNILWKGRHGVRLAVEDGLLEPSPPRLGLRLARPSRLASSAAGEFRAYPLPGEDAFLLYFSGDAKLHWMFYYMVPLRVIQGETVERTATLLENIRRRLAGAQAARASSKSSR